MICDHMNILGKLRPQHWIVKADVDNMHESRKALQNNVFFIIASEPEHTYILVRMARKELSVVLARREEVRQSSASEAIQKTAISGKRAHPWSLCIIANS